MSHAVPFTLPKIKSYPGGKGAEHTLRRLINAIPPHRCFISPFLGNCAIMRHICPAVINYGCELDVDVIDAWRDAPKHYTIERRSAFDVLNVLASDPDPHYRLSLVKRAGLPVFAEVITPWLNDPSTFLFVDPPYLADTLSNGVAPYAHKLTDAEHVELIGPLKALRCNVMVCALPNMIYEHLLTSADGWHTFQYWNMTRAGKQREQVWMNYPPPVELHDYTYFGKDYRERQDIMRQADRWNARIAAMPPLKRNAFLHYLNEHKHANNEVQPRIEDAPRALPSQVGRQKAVRAAKG